MSAGSAIKAERKQSRLDDAPRDRGLPQCQVRSAGLLLCAAVFACVFF